ncbi:MAG: hypothetical protein ACN6I6_00610 [bacterium]
MKIALSTDWVIGRDHTIEMLDMLAELYREADLYTLAYKPESLLGPVVERPIHATYLSNKVQESDQLFNWAFALPSALKGLFIPCSTDAIINISRGLSHGFKKCEKTPLYTYVYELFWLTRKPAGWKQKLFWSQAKNFALKEFKKAKKIWAANQIIHDELLAHGIESEVLEPFFKVEEFPLFPPAVFKREAILIDPGTLNFSEIEQLLMSLEGEKVRLLGNPLPSLDPALFLGTPCAGELAPIFASSKLLISFDDSAFPKNALAMLSCGGRVLCPTDSNQKIYLDGEGVRFIAKSDLLTLSDLNLLQDWNPEPKKLHAHANRFHGTRFKRKVETTIQPK